MSERPRPLAALIKLAVILGVLYAAVGVLAGPLLSVKISKALTEYYHQDISIKEVRLSLWGPRLTLMTVVLNNPAEYPQQPAIEIERVIVNFDGFGIDPIHISSVTFDGVVSTLKFSDGTDNLLAVKRIISKQNRMMPQGAWGKPTIIESVQLRHSSLKSDLTTAPLQDVNLDPIGSAAQPIMLDNAIRETLRNVIQEQRVGIPSLLLQGATESLSGKINSVVRVLQGNAP